MGARPVVELSVTSVLHVSQSTGYGVAHYLENLLADQTRRGWRVTLATPADEALEAACRSLGVEHRCWPALRSPSTHVVPESRALRRILGASAPDLVHLHSSKAGLVGRLTIRARRPTIFSPHAWSFLHEGPLTQRGALAWERWAGRWADVILCGSDGERARGEQAGIKGRFETVANAIDVDRFRAAGPGERADARRELGLGTEPLAVCVGRLVEQKGQDELLTAWEQVRGRVPDATLVLIGDGPLRAEYEAQAGAGVRFAPATADVRPWYVAADVVVQPSRWETLSLSVLEALACGRSVVATDVEGMRQAIGEDAAQRAGAVVPLGDAAALAGAIADRLRDDALVAAEEQRARDRAPRFGLGPWGDAIAGVSEAVLAARRASP